jgi:tetratricopeptide (TPR) repeat protein
MSFAADLTGREAALRAALRRAPADPQTASALVDLLIATGRADQACALVEPIAARAGAGIVVLTAAGDALKACGRLDEAIKRYERARAAAPKSAVAEHNLGAALGDAQRFEEASAAADRAFAKGLDAPETWLMQARALQGLGELDRADRAYREAIGRRPEFDDAIGDLAQLIWMRTADIAEAVRPLDAALRQRPDHPGLTAKKASLLEYAGDPAAAYASIADALRRAPHHWPLQVQAAQLSSGLDPQRALAHARLAQQGAPTTPVVLVTLCQAQLAAGLARDAEATALALWRSAPNDQHAIALVATAWRLLGDPRYRTLFDYDHFVSAQTIDTPDGWPRLSDYLADLAEALAQRHLYRTHPVGQSVRHGSQTEQTLTLSENPVIRAFFQAIEGPIRRHIAGLGRGDDPVRRRIAAAYQLLSVWSVRLEPGGSHTNHVHPKGWLSSACYIALPGAVESGHEGWLKLGEPGVATAPALAPEGFVRPEPGRLVLFPSYMWHGVVPFGGSERRLTVAFDVAPA